VFLVIRAIRLQHDGNCQGTELGASDIVVEENVYFWCCIVMPDGKSPSQTTGIAMNKASVLFAAQRTPIHVKHFKRGRDGVAKPAFFSLQHSQKERLKGWVR
jgi:hypothetical protein